ncbi:MAG: flagellar type III secretion system pore protein FliP [Bacillota bacterium]
MNKKYLPLIIILTVILLLNFAPDLQAQETQEFLPDINFEISSPTDDGESGNDFVLSLRILLILTVLTLAPAIIIMVTSFTRIVIVLSIIRRALAVRSMPPNQVIIGLAIFMTIFIMAPVWQDINTEAVQPYIDEQITTEEALDNTVNPLRDFMFDQTREKDISLFVNMANIDRPENQTDIPTYVLIPAFVISEIKIAFQIGFMIYIPFLMIDMVVASILMSMGMMMLPPVIISLPFKLLLFVLVDGWYLIIESLMRTF